MSENEFWDIIENNRIHLEDIWPYDNHLLWLCWEVSRVNPKKRTIFQKSVFEKFNSLYTQRHMEIIGLHLFGLMNDGGELNSVYDEELGTYSSLYFKEFIKLRFRIIAEGKEAYNSFLKNPYSLIDVLKENKNENEKESLSYFYEILGIDKWFKMEYIINDMATNKDGCYYFGTYESLLFEVNEIGLKIKYGRFDNYYEEDFKIMRKNLNHYGIDIQNELTHSEKEYLNRMGYNERVKEYKAGLNQWLRNKNGR